MLFAAPARSAPTSTSTTTVGSGAEFPPLDVIEVTGRIDRIEANFIERSVRAAARGGSQLLVVQLDSPGVLLSRGGMDRLIESVQGGGGVPVAVWVGTSGARAYGQSVRLLRAAAVSGISNGAHVGRFTGDCPECRPGGDPLATGHSISAGEAKRTNAVDLVSPTLGDFIVELDGRDIGGGRTLHTAHVVQRDNQPRREPAVQVRFAKINLVERVLHATTSPSVAYLLFVLGLLLMVFEFYSVGIGLAGLTGAGSLALSAYGLAALGATPVGLLLIAVAAFGYAIDVQAGAPRAWTVIGTASLVVGSWALFPGGRRVPLIPLVLVVLGAFLFMVRGMASMVRARFSTPTIGRESMIGEAAEATTRIDPEGMVRLRGATWRARVNRATPIAVGEGVRVVAIDGLVLEVEPADEPADGGSGGEH